MNFRHINKQLVTFCSVSLLFLGSLFYLISVAFKDTNTLKGRQQASGVEEALKALEE